MAVGGFAFPVDNQKDPQLLEALGIRSALEWIKERNRTKVIIESDCSSIVESIRSNKGSSSMTGMVIWDCIDLLSTLSDVRVVFVRRSANSAIHSLARESGSFNGLHVWGL